MAPKRAMKVMKSATKRSRNPVDVGPARPKTGRSWSSTSSTGSSTHSSESSAAKGKSKNTKDKSNKSAPDEFRIWTGNGWGKTQNKQILKPQAEPNPVAKKIPEELRKKPAAAPEKSKKDESELVPAERKPKTWRRPSGGIMASSSEECSSSRSEEKLKKKPAAAPEKSKKDESELAPTDRLSIWITPDSNDLEEWSEWSSPSEYHMQ